MKKGIHPEYHRCTVTCVSCGNTFETGSVLKEIKVDTCANCHPFYTGKQRFVQSDGRVDRFNVRLKRKEIRVLRIKNSLNRGFLFCKKDYIIVGL